MQSVQPLLSAGEGVSVERASTGTLMDSVSGPRIVWKWRLIRRVRTRRSGRRAGTTVRKCAMQTILNVSSVASAVPGASARMG